MVSAVLLYPHTFAPFPQPLYTYTQMYSHTDVHHTRSGNTHRRTPYKERQHTHRRHHTRSGNTHLLQLLHQSRTEQCGAMAVGLKVNANVKRVCLWVQVLHAYTWSGKEVLHAYT